jgi:chemotaxis protein MotA
MRNAIGSICLAKRRDVNLEARPEESAMWQLIGLVGVFAAIGGGYTIEGGKFGVIADAIGPELLIILGPGVMTVIISNEISTVKALLGGFKKIISGPCWRRADYADALCFMFLLFRVVRQEGNVALEKHIEDPGSSAIFNRYPRLAASHHFVAFVADVFRAITLNFTDPYKVGEMMELELDKWHDEEMRAPKALSAMADALPALGIVAAVLGVIKAMGSINESPDILGHMIGTALVGTLLGVFLSYGLFGPIAGRLKSVLEEESVMLGIIRQVITSHLEGLGPQLAVEVGRMSVPSWCQPSFDELDQMLTETARSSRAKGDG